MLDGKRSSVQASQGSGTVISISHTLLHSNMRASDSARLSDKARSAVSSAHSPSPPLLSFPLGPWSCLTSESVKAPVELALLATRPNSRAKGPQPPQPQPLQLSAQGAPSQVALDLCEELEASWRPFVLLDRPMPRRINPIPTSIVFEPGAPLGLPADSVMVRFRILPPALYRCRGPSDTHLCYVLYTGLETIPGPASKSQLQPGQPGQALGAAQPSSSAGPAAVRGQAAVPLPSGSLSTLVNVPCVPRAVRSEVLSRPAAANISQDLAVLVACVGLAERSLQSLGRNRSTPFSEAEGEAEAEADGVAGTSGSSEGAAESPLSDTVVPQPQAAPGAMARRGAEAQGSLPMPGSPALSLSLGSNRFVGIDITAPAAEPGAGAGAPKRAGPGLSALASAESQRQEVVHLHHALETVRDLASRLLAYSDANDLSNMSGLIRALGRRGRELSRAHSEVTAGAAAARERERCLAHRIAPVRTKGLGSVESGPSEAAATARQALPSSAASSVSYSSRSSGQSTPSAAGSVASRSSGGAGSPVAAVQFGQVGPIGSAGTGPKSKAAAAQLGAQAQAQEFQDASEVLGSSTSASLSVNRISMLTIGTNSYATVSEAPAGLASLDSPAAAQPKPGSFSVDEFVEIQPAPAKKKPAPPGVKAAVGSRAAAASGATRFGPVVSGPRVMPVGLLTRAGAETFFEATSAAGVSSSSDSAYGVAIGAQQSTRRSSEPGYGHAFNCSLERQKARAHQDAQGPKSQASAAAAGTASGASGASTAEPGPGARPAAAQGFFKKGSFLKLFGFRRGTASVLF